MNEHPLLRRLLRKAGASDNAAPSLETWSAFLELVARTYGDADQDRYTLERSIEISSQEMQRLYEELKRRAQHELATERERVVSRDAIIRATLESATEGIVVIDSERRVLAANQRFGEMTDAPRQLLDQGDQTQILANSARAWQLSPAQLARIAEIHTTNERYRDHLVLHDGREIERESAPILLEDGTPVGRVTFFRDVTQERRTRREIEAAREAAEAASRAKSMFLANMSHELRTPLNAVIGLSELLLLDGAEPVTEQQREYLQGIADSGRHLLALVNDVLDLAKIEAGKQSLDLDNVEVASVIEDCVATLEPLAQQRKIALGYDGVDAYVRADRIRLRQVIYNLLSNALKFTEPGGSVKLCSRTEGADVLIAVADTGIGIADQDIPRLYRAFEQIEHSSGERPPGTGLGLALTKRLVEMHGGSIAVTSRLGVGTTFNVRLPGVT